MKNTADHRQYGTVLPSVVASGSRSCFLECDIFPFKVLFSPHCIPTNQNALVLTPSNLEPPKACYLLDDLRTIWHNIFIYVTLNEFFVMCFFCGFNWLSISHLDYLIFLFLVFIVHTHQYPVSYHTPHLCINTQWRPCVSWHRGQLQTEIKPVANIFLAECNIFSFGFLVLTPTVFQPKRMLN